MAFELMHEMGWTWPDYEGTPLYVRQFCWDFIMRRRRIINARNTAGTDDSHPGVRVRRVKY